MPTEADFWRENRKRKQQVPPEAEFKQKAITIIIIICSQKQIYERKTENPFFFFRLEAEFEEETRKYCIFAAEGRSWRENRIFIYILLLFNLFYLLSLVVILFKCVLHYLFILIICSVFIIWHKATSTNNCVNFAIYIYIYIYIYPPTLSKRSSVLEPPLFVYLI